MKTDFLRELEGSQPDEEIMATSQDANALGLHLNRNFCKIRSLPYFIEGIYNDRVHDGGLNTT